MRVKKPSDCRPQAARHRDRVSRREAAKGGVAEKPNVEAEARTWIPEHQSW